jgi:hypothetical protein
MPRAPASHYVLTRVEQLTVGRLLHDMDQLLHHWRYYFLCNNSAARALVPFMATAHF